MLDPDTKILGVLGNPVKHSFSPIIHNIFLKSNGINAHYYSFEIQEDDIGNVIKGALALGFLGFNVTMPFKETVIGFLDEIDADVEKIGSVNTIRFYHDRKISKGFNTDGAGLIRSIENSCFEWEGKKVLIIGAGGAAKSAIYSILKKPVKKIMLYNRTYSKALGLFQRFSKNADNKIEVLKNLKIKDDAVKKIDMVINCTPLGMKGVHGKELPIPHHWDLKGKTVFDMVYYPIDTCLLKKAKNDGAKTIKGIDMLLNQAVQSFYLWFGVRPATEQVREVLLDEDR